MSPQISYLAVIAAAIAQMVIGFIWYGPLFGKQWGAIVGVSPDAKPKPEAMVAMIVSALIMSFVLAHSLVFAAAYTHINGVPSGLAAGFWNWLGFVAPVTLGPVLWEGKPLRLWAINAGYYFVTLPVMGIILALLT